MVKDDPLGTSEVVSRLRGLLYEEPSEEGWRAVQDLIGRLHTNDDLLVVQDHLRPLGRWPEEIRAIHLAYDISKDIGINAPEGRAREFYQRPWWPYLCHLGINRPYEGLNSKADFSGVSVLSISLNEPVALLGPFLRACTRRMPRLKRVSLLSGSASVHLPGWHWDVEAGALLKDHAFVSRDLIEVIATIKTGMWVYDNGHRHLRKCVVRQQLPASTTMAEYMALLLSVAEDPQAEVFVSEFNTGGFWYALVGSVEGTQWVVMCEPGAGLSGAFVWTRPGHFSYRDYTRLGRIEEFEQWMS